MPNSNYSTVDVSYKDPRTGQLVRERRVQDVPPDEIENVRQRELDSMRFNRDQRALVPRDAPEAGALTRRDNQYNDDDDDDDNGYYERRKVTRQRYSDDDVRNTRRRRDLSGSSSSRSPDRRRRHQRRRSSHRSKRAWSEAPVARAENEIEGFYQKNFDSSGSGIYSAAAGAALGGWAAHHFGKENETGRHGRVTKSKSSTWKTLGGAVLGAAAFNAAENRFQDRDDDKDDRRR